MSAGGSALMANYVLLGLLLVISNSARRPKEQDAAEAAQRQLSSGDPDSPGTAMIPVSDPKARGSRR